MLKETAYLLHYLYHHSMITSKQALLWFNYKTQNTKNKTHFTDSDAIKSINNTFRKTKSKCRLQFKWGSAYAIS